MNKDIEKLLKIQGKINKMDFHLCVSTNLVDEYRWVLYQVFVDEKAYFSPDNKSIMNSEVDSIDDLMNYLEKHNGFLRNGRW